MEPTQDETSANQVSGKILLVEDDVFNQQLIQLMLNDTGATLTVVDNGQQAVDCALATTFDLILMDIQLPIMSGIDATKALRGSGYKKPIVALTASIAKQDVLAYLHAGFDDFTAKPIKRSELLQIIAAYLIMVPTIKAPLSEVGQEHEAINRSLSQPLSSWSILYAEDNKVSQQIVEHVVADMNAKLTIVEDGEHAVEEAISGNFDLIIMDTLMPVMSGLEAIKWIRESGFCGSIVVAMTNTSTEDTESYYHAGCDDVIAKPFDRKLLRGILNKYLNTADNNGPNSLLDDESWQNNPAYQALVRDFVQGLPHALQEIKSTFDRGDWEHLQFLAHALKGSASNFGQPGIAKIAAILQDVACEGNYEQLASLYKELEKFIKTTM